MGHQSMVDILVTDVIMPRLDGKRPFEKMKEIRPEMKILFMGGYTKEPIMERGTLEDAFNFMVKPVSFS